MPLTDERLVATMREFVTASNRLENLSSHRRTDLRLLEEVAEQRRLAGIALQEALVERGWRSPSYDMGRVSAGMPPGR